MPAEVADPVAVGVRERARVDLVDDRGLPPRLVRPARPRRAAACSRSRISSGSISVVGAAAARDDDAGGGHARDARDAEQLPVVRSHGSRRLGSVPGLALDDAIALVGDGRPVAVPRPLAGRPRDPDRDQRAGQPRRHGRRARRPPAAAVARRARPLAARRLDAASASAACSCTCSPTPSARGASATASAPGCASSRASSTREHEDKLMKVIERFDGRSFPSSAGLARQWLTGRYRRRESSLETVYCAELVAHHLPARWACCPAAGRRAGTTPGASGAATASTSCRRSRSAARSRSADRHAALEQLAQHLGLLRAGDRDAAVDHERRHRGDADRRARSARRRAPRRCSGRSRASRDLVRGEPDLDGRAARASRGREISSPSVRYARRSRSFIASCRPWAAARWSEPVGVERVADRARSKWNSSPSAAAIVASCAWRARACSTRIAVLGRQVLGGGRPRAGGAPGSSSNERQTHLDLVGCSNPASAASKRRLPT